jgi:hypothetical protein
LGGTLLRCGDPLLLLLPPLLVLPSDAPVSDHGRTRSQLMSSLAPVAVVIGDCVGMADGGEVVTGVAVGVGVVDGTCTVTD